MDGTWHDYPVRGRNRKDETFYENRSEGENIEVGFWGQFVTPDRDWDRALVCVCVCVCLCVWGGGGLEIWNRYVGTVFIKTFLSYLRALFVVQEIPKLKAIPTKISFSLQ